MAVPSTQFSGHDARYVDTDEIVNVIAVKGIQGK